jgi:CBS domain-containing protein
MLDDPVARKVIHGYQSGGIVVHPVAGACVGIINERDVQRSFEVGRCMLTRG